MNRRIYIKLLPHEINNRRVIRILVGPNQKIENELRTIFNATWHQDLNCWYIPAEQFNPFGFYNFFKEYAFIDYSALKGSGSLSSKTGSVQSSVQELPPGYLETLRRKRYSDNTIRVYCRYFSDFEFHFSGKDLSQLDPGQINDYILFLISKNCISISQQNQRINAIKFYYEKVLGKKKLVFNIERPRRERKLPGVLDKTEIQRIINATDNLKHKCILSLIYSSGLRRNELLSLKSEDVDSKRMLIKVRSGKGKKDRYTILSVKLLELLRDYYKQYRPQIFLFEGPSATQYSATSIQNILKKSAIKAGIKKRVHIHMLRHSFATHLLEQGTSLRIIQELLGHDSIKTTEIYTHVTKTDIEKLNNPFDNIFK
jgi:integrase/recombinase XerD